MLCPVFQASQRAAHFTYKNYLFRGKECICKQSLSLSYCSSSHSLNLDSFYTFLSIRRQPACNPVNDKPKNQHKAKSVHKKEAGGVIHSPKKNSKSKAEDNTLKLSFLSLKIHLHKLFATFYHQLQDL